MTSLLSASSGPVVHAALTLERKDIVFHNPNPEEVEISITLSHVADRPSAPAMVRMQAAPLGAFVPWQPLGDVLVPMLEPRRRHILRFRLQRPRPTVLGDPSQLPIARLLNALARAEPQRAPGAQLLLRFGGGSIGFQTGALPADLQGSSRIRRGERVVWEKPFATGEANMCHTLLNLEYHHFKYAQHRRPGDVHLHFFGTATLSFADGFRVEPGDRFEIEQPAFGAALVNPLTADSRAFAPGAVYAL